ncbi:RING-H2 finger protein ATL56-like [Nicotiana sylvestris]|uniref:RING-H2 finger protein ATL56-like n=1 Tax=Nicotiana sylvestris TaxID=4096 RepID=UPI00388CA9C0
MGFSAAELPPPLSMITIFAIIIAYMVICYLVLDLIDQQQGDTNDEISRMDVCASGLSVEELKEINCFYIKGQANSTCTICLDILCDAELCRSFPACNHVFHAQCIDPWLAKKPTCPTCRMPFRPQFSFLQ